MNTAKKSIDLKSLAYDLLHNAQRQLQRQDHVTPLLFMITPQEKLMFQIEESDPEERQEIYANLLAQAREKNALAVVRVRHISLPSEPSASTSPEQQRAIIATISGPGFQTWALISRYVRNGDQIVFQPAEEQSNPGGITG